MHATLGADEASRFKREAGERAAELVQPGMVVGLGTGSTAIFATRRIAERLGDGSLRDIVGVPTSKATEAEARRLGIPLAADDLPGAIDLTIDGADEVDPKLNLIKGGGGALLREKIVATISRREVIVVDESKLSPVLGTHWALPVEVIPFGWRAQLAFLQSLGAVVTRREAADGGLYHSDQGNFILDAEFGPIIDAAALAAQLAARPGIVEHGLFLGLATDCFVAGPTGVRQITRR